MMRLAITETYRQDSAHNMALFTYDRESFIRENKEMGLFLKLPRLFQIPDENVNQQQGSQDDTRE